MPDYPKMYAILCAAASEAIDLIAAGSTAQAAEELQRALLTAEELYVKAAEDLETVPSLTKQP